MKHRTMVGPKSNDWRPHEKSGQRHTQERRPWKDRGRAWRGAATEQGTLRIASNEQQLGTRHGTHSLSGASERRSAADPSLSLLDF